MCVCECVCVYVCVHGFVICVPPHPCAHTTLLAGLCPHGNCLQSSSSTTHSCRLRARFCICQTCSLGTAGARCVCSCPWDGPVGQVVLALNPNPALTIAVTVTMNPTPTQQGVSECQRAWRRRSTCSRMHFQLRSRKPRKKRKVQSRCKK